LPGGKFLFLLRQEKEPKEGDPDIPETSDTQRCRVGVAELAPLLQSLFIFVSGAQTGSAAVSTRQRCVSAGL
jgi:hypothetical protein